jgi:Trypsin-co-occurring domain 1
MDDSKVLVVDLGNQQTILVEARTDDPTPNPERPVSIAKSLPFDGVAESIDAISTRIVAALERAKPDKATVGFGLDVCVESGQLTSLLVKGSGKATINVTLEWSSSNSAGTSHDDR